MIELDFLALFSVAFLSSLSHCYAMCGGFALLFMRLNSNSKNLFFLNFFYHSARVFAYLILAAIFWAFGNFLMISSRAQGLIFFILGIFMALLGLALLIRGKFLKFFENDFFSKLIFSKFSQNAKNLKGIKSALIFGFCNGVLPCGLVYFFIVSAMSRQSLNEALLVMFCFGICTIFNMLFFAKFFSLINNFFKKFFGQISYVIIIIYGLNLAFLGLKTFR